MSSAGSAPLRVGLVGAGPWAQNTHAPVLAAGPETELVSVWARRPDAAAGLAARHGARACGSVEELIDSCEAVAFAVPPDVQAALAPLAARAGRHVLLDKPIALDVPGAERIASAVADAGVGSMVFLTNRYAAGTRAFLREAAGINPIGGRGWFIAESGVQGPYSASPWRQEYGALLDLGPHIVDVLDAALGPVVPGSVRALGSSTRWLGLLLEHESGAVSEVSLCMTTLAGYRQDVAIYSADRVVEWDARGEDRAATHATVRREFAETARGVRHPCDAAHGLRLQRILAEAGEALARG